MRSGKRARTIAVGGIASILIGAVLLIAPTSAGATHVAPVLNPGGNDNPSCANLGYEFEAKKDSSGSAGQSGTVSGDGLVVNWTFHADKTISFTVDATSNFDVSAAIVKQGSANSGGGANVYDYDPPVPTDSGLVDPKGDGQFSHLTFCAETPDDTTTSSSTTSSTSTSSTSTTTTSTTTTTVAVGGEQETPTTVTPTTAAPTTAAPATAAAEVEVKGVTVTRTLPRTGSGTGHLATAGIALMIFGGILVGGSRRALLGNS